MSTRLANGKAAWALLAGFLWVTACTEAEREPASGLLTDYAGGIDADFGVEAFALDEPTLTIAAPAPGSQIAAGAPKAPVELSFTVAFHDLAADKGKIRCFFDNKDAFTTFATTDAAANTIADLGAGGVKVISCVLVDASGNKLTNAKAFATTWVYVTKPCNLLEDCNDGSACSTESCIANKCIYQHTAGCCMNTLECGVGETCTSPNSSDAKCSACTSKADCDDGFSCTVDSCDLSGPKGLCKNVKAPEDCCGTSPNECDDGLACTVDSCDNTTGKCKHVKLEGVCCSDKDCTTTDTCLVGSCVDFECRFGPDAFKSDCCSATFNPNCNDNNYCTVDKCDQQKSGYTSCSHVPDPNKPNCCDTYNSTNECDDGDTCTYDVCAENQCVHKTIGDCCKIDADCNDGDPCTTGKCDVATQHCTYPKIDPLCCTVNLSCNDGKLCTTDTCNKSANAETGTCQFQVTDSKCCDTNEQCDDGKYCTVGQCVNHSCVFGPDAFKPGCCEANSDCNDANACTLDTCDVANHVCKAVSNGDPNCCNANEDCDDNNCATLGFCDITKQCVFKADPTKCSTTLDCDDKNPCTVDSCDKSGSCGVCIHTPDTQCCTVDSQCNDGKVCTTDKCVNNKCANDTKANCCVDDKDAITACDDSSPCTIEYCVNNTCRHTVPKNGCCTSDANCTDAVDCTIDKCQNITNGQGTCANIVPAGCEGCTTANQAVNCNDNNACTADICVGGACTHQAISGCCLDKFDCDDGQPCTTDFCVENLKYCVHAEYGGSTALCCSKETEGTDCAYLNTSCAKGICETQADNSRKCVSQPVDICTVQVSYCQDFATGTSLKAMGWNPGNVKGTAATNWKISTAAGLGPDQYAELTWTPTYTDYDTCLQSPILQAAGSKTITLQYDQIIDLNKMGTTSVRLLGSLDGANVDWTKATLIDVVNPTADVPAATLDVKLPPELTGSNGLRLAFCVAGKTTFDLTKYGVDNVCVAKGGKPSLTQCSPNQVVALFGNKTVPLKAKDPDADAILTYSVVSGPSFVTLSSAYYYWLDGTWNSTLTIAPKSYNDVGTHKVTLKVSDGFLYSLCSFEITVTYVGGYLVWRPSEVPEAAGAALHAAIKANYSGVVQHVTDIGLYPSLTGFSGVFISLGVFPDNHILKESEVGALKLFLQGGGSIYLEAGDTWAVDSKTSLHPFFAVKPQGDGSAWGVTGPLAGAQIYKDISTSPTKIYNYEYATGDYNWDNANDQLLADSTVKDTRNVLSNDGAKDFFWVQVAHQDPAVGYKTVASSVLFGGVMAGVTDAPKTMVGRIINFFNNGFIDCSKPEHCDDGDACTKDICVSQTCKHVNECTCQGAGALSCGAGKAFDAGSAAATNTVDTYSCDPSIKYDAPEIAWEFTSTESKPITLDVSSVVNATAKVFVLKASDSGCDPAQCIASGNVKVNFAAAKGAKYFIVLDAKGTNAPSANITTTCGIAEICDDGKDNNGNGLVDCNDLGSCCGDAACGEICDDQDNDCDGQTDEGCDDDGDDYCDGTMTTVGKPAACPNTGKDCNDDNAAVNPGLLEICSNGKDDNCDGQQDEEGAAGCTKYYIDLDKDGYGTGTPKCLCAASGAYQASKGGDCNDADPKVNPTDQPEICNNGVDDDCTGTQNDLNAIGCTDFYTDTDKDGWGTTPKKCLCFGEGATTAGKVGDCDDADKDKNPGKVELCNGKDDDCDYTIDEGCDDDKDGYCDADLGYVQVDGVETVCGAAPENQTLVLACKAGSTITSVTFASFGKPSGSCGAFTAGACNSAMSLQKVKDACLGKANCSITASTTVFGDPCSGVTKELRVELVCTSSQGAPPPVCPKGPGDTDDTDPNINPNGKEICDGVDNNSDGKVDEGCDDDGDGYCDKDMIAIGAPSSCPKGGGDCVDTKAFVNPGAAEDCNTPEDDNCDGELSTIDAANCTPLFYDGDSDKYGTSLFQCLCAPVGKYTAPKTGDCDDTDPTLNPGNLETCDDADNNCDGAIDEGCDDDSDGYCDAKLQVSPTKNPSVCPSGGGDCADTNAQINPGKAEVCGNNVDDNCDGSQNDPDASGCTTYYVDADQDTYGTSSSKCLCTPAGSYSATNKLDCDDSDKAVKPGTVEVCDGKDNDCDGVTDNGCDDDNDDYCDSGMSIVGTPATCSKGGGDCDDAKASVNPGVTTEACDDLDDDCDGVVDGDCDKDKDGYCDATMTVSNPLPKICTKGANDCNDFNNDQNPGSPEVCGNGIDDDCDGSQNDENATNCATFFFDGDNDGYGLNLKKCLCIAQGSFKASKAGDCADTNAAVNPGATEVCGDGLDNNCDGSENDPNSTGCSDFYLDQDGDGFGISGAKLCLCVADTTYKATTAGDCNDTNKDVSPGKPELCDNIDNNCDSKVDEGCNDDADGYCDSSMTTIGFPNVCVKGGGDCDDTKSAVNPGTAEVCDNLDNNCNTSTDEGCDDDNDDYCDAGLTTVGTPTTCSKGGGDCKDDDASVNPGKTEDCATLKDDNCNGSTNDENATGCKNFGVDADGDNYSDINGTNKCLCVAEPPLTGLTNGDCNDKNKLVNPAITEICDGVDNNCDGKTDEGCDDDGDDYCDAGMATIGKPAACPNGGGDCNDAASSINPGAAEVCGNSTDENCNGDLNGVDATGCSKFYYDGDNDGWAVNLALCLCSAMDNYKISNDAKVGDCDDTSALIYPGAAETCGDGKDSNCNGSQNDPGAINCKAFYKDADKDGYGGSASACLCVAEGEYITPLGGDCNESDAEVNPGASELCDNKDNNCTNGADDGCDDDNDDYCDSSLVTIGSPTVCPKGGGDCDDTASAINPATLELCDNLDQDCDGVADNNCDSDSDGYCDAAKTVVGTPAICTKGKGDCDDTNSLVNPGKSELCDNADNNCDGVTDEDCDADGDGYCTNNKSVIGTPTICTKGVGDCNDTNDKINPGALEDCNGIDDNCAGGIDETCNDGDGDGYCVGNVSVSSGCPKGGNDCDDANDAINPGATEDCSTPIDDNCNNLTNEENATNCITFFKDVDGDLYGSGEGICLCSQQGEYGATRGGDCDETNAKVHPNATEICDGLNNDCDYEFKAGAIPNPKNPIIMETYSHGGGYHFFRKEYWYPNWNGPTIYRYNASYQYLGNFNGGQSNIMGLTGDLTEDAWYSSNWGENTVRRRNSTNGLVWSYNVGSTSGGCAVDANYVYAMRANGPQVYKLNRANGALVQQFNLSVDHGGTLYGGLAVIDGKLWKPTTNGPAYYRYDLDPTNLGVYDGTNFTTVTYAYNGAWNGKELCISANSNQVYCYTPPASNSSYAPRVIGVDPKSHGGGFSLYNNEYWYPEWAGGTIWRYGADSKPLGSFNSGQAEIRQLWGPKEEDAYYIARFSSSSTNSYIRKLVGKTSTMKWSSPYVTTYLSSVASEGNTVYAMRYNSSAVYKYDAANGAYLGSFSLSGDYDGDTLYGGIAIVDGKFYRGTVSNRNVYRYDLATGVHDGVKFKVAPNIYGLAYNGKEFCFSSTSGNPYCYVVPSGAVNFSPTTYGVNPRSHGGGWHEYRKEYWYPLWAGSQIYRYDETGKAIGDFNCAQSSIMQVAGELDSDTYYLALYGGSAIKKMQGLTSAQVWSNSVSSNMSGVAVDSSYVYAMRYTGNTVWRLNRDTGATINSFGLNTYSNSTYGIAVRDGVLWRSNYSSQDIWGYNASNGVHNNVKIRTPIAIYSLSSPPGKLCAADSSTNTPYCYDIAAYSAIAPKTDKMPYKGYGGGYHPNRNEWWFPEWSGTKIYRYDTNKNLIGSFDTVTTGGGPGPLTVFSVGSQSKGSTLGSIPGKPGASILIKRIGICGDADSGSGPARFSVNGAGLGFSWAAGQYQPGQTHWLGTTPNVGGSARGFTYANVSYTGAVGQGVNVVFDLQNDWDGRYCNATDAHGNSYSDSSSTARVWIEYQYSSGGGGIDSIRQVAGDTTSDTFYAVRYNSSSGYNYSYVSAYDGMPGSLKWSSLQNKQDITGYLTGVAVHGQHVYVNRYNSSQIYALRKDNGLRDSAKDFTLSPYMGSYAYGGFTIVGDKLYRPASDNFLYRYDVGSGVYDGTQIAITGNPYAYGTNGTEHCFGYDNSSTTNSSCITLSSDPNVMGASRPAPLTGSYGAGYHPYYKEHWYAQSPVGMIARHNTAFKHTGSFNSGLSNVRQLVGDTTTPAWFAVQYSGSSTTSRIYKMKGTDDTQEWVSDYVTTLLSGLAADDTTLYANRYNNSTIYKFDRKTGASTGSFNLTGQFSGSAMYGGLAVDGTKLFRATTDRVVYRYDLSTGIADGLFFQVADAPYGLTSDGDRLCFNGGAQVGQVDCYTLPPASFSLKARPLGMDTLSNGGGFHPFHNEYWYSQWNTDLVTRYSTNYASIGTFKTGIPSIAQLVGEKTEDSYYLAKYSGSSADSKVYKLKGKTQTQVWAGQYLTTYLGGVAVDDKYVYTMPYTSTTVYRLSKSSGSLVSQFTLQGLWRGGTMYGTLTVDGNRLYRGSTANYTDAYDITSGTYTGTSFQLAITPYSSAFNGKEICYGQSAANAPVYCYALYTDNQLTDESCDDDADGYCDATQTISGDTSQTCPKSKQTCDGTLVGSTCYKPVNTGATWPQAKAWCENWGGALSTVGSQAQGDTIHSLTGAACGPISYWVGANDAISEGSFSWLVGQTTSYTNWKTGEPSSVGTGGKFTGGSMLNSTQMAQLNQMYGNANQNWKRCYSKTVNGASSGTFHSLCDNKGPTFTIVKANTGMVFGGYTSVSWNSSSSYATDANAFLFSLDRNEKAPAQSGGPNAIYRNSGYGPTFGGGHDLYINGSMNGGYTYFGYNYVCPVGGAGSSNCQNWLAGNYSSWSITDMEVYYKDASGVSNGQDYVAVDTDKTWSDMANATSLNCFVCERQMTNAQYGNGDDCNDADPAIGPNQAEICDGKDNNCNGQVDEGCDDDGDGYCDAAMAVVGTPAVCVKGGNDCSDFNKNINPGQKESCLTTYDDNCDGSTSAVNAVGCVNLYYDDDADGFGTSSYQCECPSSECQSAAYEQNFDATVTGWTYEDCAAGTQTTPTSCTTQADAKGWQIATNVLYSTPKGALYYGDAATKSFNFGASAGRAVSGVVTLPTSTELKLSTSVFLGTSADPNTDILTINILTSNGATRTKLWDKKQGANDHFPQSKILSSSDKVTLNTWYGNPNQQWQLCYQKTRDGASSSTFHALCNGKGPTISIMKVTNGRVFGGYNANSWASVNNYVYNTANWLFSLTGGTKHPVGSYPQYATYDTSSYGPTFGGGHDLHLDSGMNSGYTNIPHSYQCSGSCNSSYFAGQYSGWQTTEVEVYYLGGASTSPTNAWMQLEHDLSNFSGQKVQFEFYFNTVNAADNTGFGVAVDNVRVINKACSKYSAPVAGDCDDTNPLKFPSAAAEACDGLDNNCNGVIDEACDLDGDGYCGADKPVSNSPACPKTGKGVACISTTSSSPTFDGAPLAMTYYGAHGTTQHKVRKEIWHANWASSNTTIYRWDENLNFKGTFNSGLAYVRGLAADPVEDAYYGGEYYDYRVVKKSKDTSTALWYGPSMGFYVGGVAADANAVYSMRYNNQTVYVSNKATGAFTKTFSLTGTFGGSVHGGLHVLDDKIYRGSSDGWVRAYSLSNGAYANVQFQATGANYGSFIRDDTRWCTNYSSNEYWCYKLKDTNCTQGDDCNDQSKNIAPGATEYCDGVDNNCDGQTDEGCDDDNDDYCDSNMVVIGTPPTCSKGGGDCNDASVSENPATKEICDGKDNNCDKVIDEPGATNCVSWYYDGDQDGYGVSTNKQCLCASTGLYTTKLGGDCDDTCATCKPGAAEICDDKNNDCDASVDEGCDDDGDDYCDAGMLTVGKPAICPNGAGDCNDSASSISPGKVETCNNVDDNCNGKTDENASDQCTTSLPNTAAACVAGACQITGCDPGFYDINGVTADGCECNGNDNYEPNNACSQAALVSSNLHDGVGGRVENISGRLVHNTDFDWFRFYAADQADGGTAACDNFRLRVRFLSNPGSYLRFDIYRGACPPDNNSAGLWKKETHRNDAKNQANQVCCGQQDFNWFTNYKGYVKDYNVTGESEYGQCNCTTVTTNFSTRYGYNLGGGGPYNRLNASTGVYHTTNSTAYGFDKTWCHDDSDWYYIKVFKYQGPAYCGDYQLEISNGVYSPGSFNNGKNW